MANLIDERGSPVEIKSIAASIVDDLVQRTNELSQGRNAGCFGYVNEEGVIDTHSPFVNGGLNGLPLRQLLSHITEMDGKSLLEGMNALPENAVLITSRPGKTGLITDVGGVDFFNLPIVTIGVKEGQKAGIGIIFPRDEYFDLATESENIDLKILAASSMEEEKEILRRSVDLSLRYLDLSRPLEVEDINTKEKSQRKQDNELSLPRLAVNSIDRKLAEELVAKSMEVGQGREVAMMCEVNEEGHVVRDGEVVVGGMGYVPSRVLASSAVDISGRSLKEIYTEEVSPRGIIVHTHPGGTGVMHIGDANAGPGTWGRPIIAVGHDKEGQVRGATVIELSDKLFDLADEDERLSLKFFDAGTPEEEADIRNRKFGVAQDYTGLCKTIQIM